MSRTAQNTIIVLTGQDEYWKGTEYERVTVQYLRYNLNPAFAPSFIPVTCEVRKIDETIAKYAHTRSKIGCDGSYEVIYREVA